MRRQRRPWTPPMWLLWVLYPLLIFVAIAEAVDRLIHPGNYPPDEDEYL